MLYLFDQITGILAALSLCLSGMFGASTPELVSSVVITGTTTATVISVIDGDTIDVILEGSKDPLRVRYIGIDTPEPYAKDVPECGSKAATIRNQELVSDKLVAIVPGLEYYDKYGRLLAYVYVDDIFVNETLVKEGYASVMMIQPNTQYQTNFNNLYKNARKEKLGIWATCYDL